MESNLDSTGSVGRTVRPDGLAVAPGAGRDGAEVVAALRDVVDRVVAVEVAGSDAAQINQVRVLEDLKAACAASQARITARFAAARRRAALRTEGLKDAGADTPTGDGADAGTDRGERESARDGDGESPRDGEARWPRPDAGSDPELLALPTGNPSSRRRRAAIRRKAERLARRSAAGEIALARRESPQRGGRFVGLADALVHEMPHTFAALQSGVINEWRATIIVRETACLSREQRAEADTAIAADPARLHGLGDRRLAARVKRIIYRLDAQAATARAVKAAGDRRVTLRPAPDCMAYLTQLLPVATATACYAALQHAADTRPDPGDDRTRQQRMADEATRRIITGGGPTGTTETSSSGSRSDAGVEQPPRNTGSVAALTARSGRADPVDFVRRAYAEYQAGQHTTGRDRSATSGTATNGADPSGADPNGADPNGADPNGADPNGADPNGADPTNNEHHSSETASVASSPGSPPDTRPAPSPGVTTPAATADRLPPGTSLVLNMTISDHTLLAEDDEPALLPGNIPIPAPLARRMIAGLPADTNVWIRRLYTRPDTQQLVAIDSRRRTFTPAMRQQIFTRDLDTCRTPWCNAPARHADHVIPASTGGPTSIANGQALSEDCNYTRTAPGWTAAPAPDGTIITTSPTGHRYSSPPEPQPARATIDIRTGIEDLIEIQLAQTG